MPDATPISARFSAQAQGDVPPGVPPLAAGTAPMLRPLPTPPQSGGLGAKIAALRDRALAQISSLLGQNFTQPPSRAAQLEAGLNALQARSTPNILATVPSVAPLIAPPATPVGTPKPSPTPFSLDGWLAAQNSKGQ